MYIYIYIGYIFWLCFISNVIITASNTFSRYLLFMMLGTFWSLHQTHSRDNYFSSKMQGFIEEAAYDQNMVCRFLGPWDRSYGTMRPGPCDRVTGPVGQWDRAHGTMGPGPNIGKCERDLFGISEEYIGIYRDNMGPHRAHWPPMGPMRPMVPWAHGPGHI